MATDVQLMEELLKQHATLQDKKTRVEVLLEAEKAKLSELQAEAVKLFGTSDINNLRELYRKKSQDNKTKIQEFKQGLEQAAQRLEDIQRQLG